MSSGDRRTVIHACRATSEAQRTRVESLRAQASTDEGRVAQTGQPTARAADERDIRVPGERLAGDDSGYSWEDRNARAIVVRAQARAAGDGDVAAHVELLGCAVERADEGAIAGPGRSALDNDVRGSNTLQTLAVMEEPGVEAAPLRRRRASSNRDRAGGRDCLRLGANSAERVGKYGCKPVVRGWTGDGYGPRLTGRSSRNALSEGIDA